MGLAGLAAREQDGEEFRFPAAEKVGAPNGVRKTEGGFMDLFFRAFQFQEKNAEADSVASLLAAENLQLVE